MRKKLNSPLENHSSLGGEKDRKKGDKREEMPAGSQAIWKESKEKGKKIGPKLV